MRLWLPVVATSSVYTINEQIAIRFATALEDGSASAMSNALVFWQLPFGIFSASITTVFFPRMSRQAGSGDIEGLKNSLEYGFRYLILLLIPSAALMCFLGREIIAVALQRGNFHAENTALTAQVLAAYSLGLLPVGAFNFFQRFFYARDNYKTPLVSAFIVCGLDIVLSLVLKETPLRVAGLALANSLAFIVGLFIMWRRAVSSLPDLSARPALRALGKSLLAALPAALFAGVFLFFTGNWWKDGSTLRNVFYLGIAGGGACGIILIMYRVMNIDILMTIIRRRLQPGGETK
jgi:putative peptidoglycan lipid II flippase